MKINSQFNKGVVLTLIAVYIICNIPVILSIEVSDKSPMPTFYRGNILYVGGDGPGNFTSIQDAIDHAYDDDTIFVYNGTYKEHLTINKKLTLLGEERNTTIIDGQYDYDNDVVYILASNVIIREFTIQRSGDLSAGLKCADCSYNIISDCDFLYHRLRTIYLLRSSHSIIENCSIQESNTGILVSEEQSDHNTISDCYISTERVALDLSSSHNKVLNCILEEGMNIHWGSNNTVLNCHISDNDGLLCIQMGYTSYNKLRNNTLKNGGIIFNVNFPYEYYHDIDPSNMIDGKPIYYLVEESNREFNETMEIGYIGLISCTNITMKNLSLHGVVLGNTSFTTIENCSFYENLLGVDIGLSTNNIVSHCDFSTFSGIRIRKSSNNIVSDCRMPIGSKYGVGVDINYYSSKNIVSNCFIANFDIGVIIGGASPSNIVSGCIISDCKVFGIWILTSDNIVVNNTIEYTTGSAIDIWGGSTNNISYNTIQSNSQGISVAGGSHNEIFCNNIRSNTNGIYLLESLNNKIIRNNFMKNKEKDAQFAAEKLSNCKNIWSDNYWNRPRFLPKLIFGRIGIYYLAPWINFDWHPARKPYDIDGEYGVPVEKKFSCHEIGEAHRGIAELAKPST